MVMGRYNKLYIIGFMGSGKTTTGARLACLAGWTFVDLDKRIEDFTGMTVPELFTARGEAFFRDMEAQLLRELKDEKHVVVSTGGGAPCHSGNMEYMIETGLTLYLELTPGQLKSRIAGTGNERPLIKDLEADELLEFIREKLSKREKWYKMALCTFNGFDASGSDIFAAIKPLLDL
jgi:shikimate kinase